MNIAIKTLEEFYLIQPNVVEKFLDNVKIEVNLKTNKVIFLVPDYQEKEETIEASIKLALNARPALLIFDTCIIEEELRQWESKIYPRTKLVDDYKKKLENIENYYKNTLTAARYSFMDKKETTYVYGQFNTGLLWG